MMTRRRRIGILLTVILLTVGIASVYAAGSNPFDTLTDTFQDYQAYFSEIWERLAGVETDVAAVEARMDLFIEIADLRARVALLESAPSGGGEQGPQGEPGEQGIQGIQGPVGPLGGFGVPDYDSGWTAIGAGDWIVIDNVGFDDDVFVYMVGRYPRDGGTTWNYHQMYYGGYEETDVNDYLYLRGAAWSLLNGELKVVRWGQDSMWDEVRVMIWQLPPPTP